MAFIHKIIVLIFFYNTIIIQYPNFVKNNYPAQPYCKNLY